MHEMRSYKGRTLQTPEMPRVRGEEDFRKESVRGLRNTTLLLDHMGIIRRDNMTKTEKNLLEAFAGESQANRKYLAFARQADKEGHKQAARLFRAAAEAETVHAHAHLKALGGIGSTAENLQEAVNGETHEFKEMYPGMIQAAAEEGNKAAERSFRYANEVEKVHAELYRKALENLSSPGDEYYYVCPVCGYTAEGEPPDSCPVCGAKGRAFFKVE
jgi:rubrerythrin